MAPALPTHPSLEHLRKQAKDLLKAQRTGDPSACGVLRRLRRFADAPDADILAADVPLSDVQFALAMEYGFASWDRLKAHVEGGAPARAALDYSGVKLGGNQCRDDAFSKVLAAACELLGIDADLDEIAVLSGNGFAPAVRTCEPCRSWWHVQAQDRCLDLPAGRVGLRVRRLPQVDHTTLPPMPEGKDALEAWYVEHFRRPSVPHIREALARGEVVITDREWDWTFHHNGWYGWSILTDAREDGTILGACLNGRNDNPAHYPGLCRALSRAEPTLDEGEAHVEVLRRAVDRIRGQGAFEVDDTRVSGLEAMDAWIGVMETDVGFCAECQERSGNGWTDAVDVARFVTNGADTARRFLRRAAETFPADAQPQVESAAGRYARIADLLAPALEGEEGQRYRDFVGDLDAQKAHADTALRPARNEFAAAADDMERALELMA